MSGCFFSETRCSLIFIVDLHVASSLKLYTVSSYYCNFIPLFYLRSKY